MEHRDKAQFWAKVLLVLLVSNGGLGLATLVAGYDQLHLLERMASPMEAVSDDEITSNDSRMAALGYAEQGLFVVTAIAWLTWLYCAYRAVTETGCQVSEQTPRWAVGCWFVPLVNLFYPLRITRELWHRSESQNAESKVPLTNPPLVVLWWVLYLGNNLLTRAWVNRPAATLADLTSATRFLLYITLFSLASVATAFFLVRTLKQMQARWSESAALAEEF